MSLLGFGAIAANTAGGLFAPKPEGRTTEERFFSGKLLEQQRNKLLQDIKFGDLSEGYRLRGLKQNNILGDLTIDRARFGQQTAQDLRGRLQSFADAPSFDTSSLQQGLLNQYLQQQKNTKSSFQQRGFGGSGAEAGALANQFTNQVSLPTANLQFQAFNNQRRNQLGALGQLGGLV